jgi:hypothetical protein
MTDVNKKDFTTLEAKKNKNSNVISSFSQYLAVFSSFFNVVHNVGTMGGKTAFTAAAAGIVQRTISIKSCKFCICCDSTISFLGIYFKGMNTDVH